MKQRGRRKRKSTPKIRIKTDGRRTFITVDGKQLDGKQLDGKQLDGVHGLKFIATAGYIPVIRLEMCAFDVEIDSAIKLPVEYAKAGETEAEYGESGI